MVTYMNPRSVTILIEEEDGDEVSYTFIRPAMVTPAFFADAEHVGHPFPSPPDRRPAPTQYSGIVNIVHAERMEVRR